MNYKENRFNRLQVFLSAGSHFIIDIYQSFIIGLIPFLTIKFDLSLFKVGLFTAISVIANSFFSPAFGFLSDRHGLKYFLVAGPLVTSIFLSLLGVLPNYYLILIFLFAGNLGIAAYHPASAAIAGHYGGSKKGLGSSLINFGGNFGNSLGSLVIILFIEKLNISYSPLIMIPGIITILILFKYIPADRNTAEKSISSSFLNRLRKINKIRLISLIFIIFTVYVLYVIWITLVTYMPLYYSRMNIGLIDIGIILLFFGMLGGASGLLTGFWFDRTKKGVMIIQVMFAVSIPMVFSIFKTTGFISILLFILSGVILISIQPVCIRLSQDLFPETMSFASSLILGFSPGLAAITMIALGKVADRVGIERLVNYEIFLLAAAFIALLFYPKNKNVRLV